MGLLSVRNPSWEPSRFCAWPQKVEGTLLASASHKVGCSGADLCTWRGFDECPWAPSCMGAPDAVAAAIELRNNVVPCVTLKASNRKWAFWSPSCPMKATSPSPHSSALFRPALVAERWAMAGKNRERNPTRPLFTRTRATCSVEKHAGRWNI